MQLDPMLAMVLLALTMTAVIVLGIRVWSLLREKDAIENRVQDLTKVNQELNGQIKTYQERFKDVIDVDQERAQVIGKMNDDRDQLQAMIDRLHSEVDQAEKDHSEKKIHFKTEAEAILTGIRRLRSELSELDEEAHIREFGFYKPVYDFATAEAYQIRLDEIRGKQKQLLKDKRAAICHTAWNVDGDYRRGEKMINERLKLMLRAFNGECDSAIAKVRYNNIGVMDARINKAFEMINKLSETMNCTITREYLDLKRQELKLVFEHQDKVQQEKEEQRRIREQMREEEIAQRELEKAKIEAEKEEQRYLKALEKAREEVQAATGAKHEKLASQIEQLERRLAEAQANKERAISRAQMTKSGHVYVISNIGSFGEQVFKIGMTRRLDPIDRILELGDASVPFRFDVHAMMFSEDAPALETKLHNLFRRSQVNRINDRKEFFRVDVDELKRVLKAENPDVRFLEVPEAEEYRRTLALIAEEEAAAIKAPESEIELPDAVAALFE